MIAPLIVAFHRLGLPAASQTPAPDVPVGGTTSAPFRGSATATTVPAVAPTAAASAAAAATGGNARHARAVPEGG